ISGTPASAFDTGQLSLAVSAAWRNSSSLVPGTFPATCRAIFVIPSPGWNVTVADAFSSSAGFPDCARPFDNAIEKQAACAAAISSSGLVFVCASCDRATQSTSKPPTAPLVTESMRPPPLIRSPCQVTSAVRSVAIRVSFQGRIDGHGRAGFDQLGQRTALARAGGELVQRGRIRFLYTRAREKLRSDDAVGAVLDLVERYGRVDIEVVRRWSGAGQLARPRHCRACRVRRGEQLVRAGLAVGPLHPRRERVRQLRECTGSGTDRAAPARDVPLPCDVRRALDAWHARSVCVSRRALLQAGHAGSRAPRRRRGTPPGARATRAPRRRHPRRRARARRSGPARPTTPRSPSPAPPPP